MNPASSHLPTTMNPPTHLLRSAPPSKEPQTSSVTLPPLPLLQPKTLSAKSLSSAGYTCYDPGLANTLSCKSSITQIQGEAGILRHRGYPITSLATHASYLELLYLLLYNALPSCSQLSAFRNALYQPRHSAIHADVRNVVTAFPRTAHPMAVLMGAVTALGATSPDLNPSLMGTHVYRQGGAAREKAILKCLGSFPGLLSGVYRHCYGLQPAFVEWKGSENARLAERFLGMCNGMEGNLYPVFPDALEKLLIVHAEHELNCSTATVRGMSSSGVDLFSSVVGGIGALYGPLHGGATESVIRMLEQVKHVGVTEFLDRVKRGEGRLMGFGHRVYRNYDPRARIIKEVAEEVFKKVGKREVLVEVAEELEARALRDDYFVKRKLFPNCDFYSGVVYKAMGFEPRFFTCLFALARVGGWVAHWKEFLDDPDRRIFRPRQVYVGVEGPLSVAPIAERDDAEDGPSADACRKVFTVAKL